MPTTGANASDPSRGHLWAQTVRPILASKSLSQKAGMKNVWLWVLCAIGTVIVIVDGLTRESYLEKELLDEGPMRYEPYTAAFVLALALLPFCLAYAAKVRIGMIEGLLLWFVLCTVSYTRDFAYIRLPELPLYVTELTLAVLMVGCLLKQDASTADRTPFLKIDLLLFWCVGVACFTRGLVSNHDSVLVFRDSAIVLYSVFFLVGAWLVRDQEILKHLFLFFCIGASFATLNGLAWFIAQPEQRRYVPYGVFVLTAFFGALLLTINKRVAPGIGWGLTGLFGCGILLANARTVYVTFVVILLLIFWVGMSIDRKKPLSRLKTLGSLVVVVVLLATVFMQTQTGSSLAQRTFDELLSGTVGFADDPNAKFRFEAWAEAIRRFLDNPLFGESYGVPFSFVFADLDVRPHNTYLTVLYKMGLFGFLPLTALIGRCLTQCWRKRKAHSHQPDSLYLYCVLIALVAMCVFGSLNLFLESPYLASIFWLVMGMSFRLTGVKPAQSSASALPRQRA